MKERLNFFHARNDHWIGRCNEIFGGLILLLRIHTMSFCLFRRKNGERKFSKEKKKAKKGAEKIEFLPREITYGSPYFWYNNIY